MCVSPRRAGVADFDASQCAQWLGLSTQAERPRLASGLDALSEAWRQFNIGPGTCASSNWTNGAVWIAD